MTNRPTVAQALEAQMNKPMPSKASMFIRLFLMFLVFPVVFFALSGIAAVVIFHN
jgi:hypothetical protein